MVVVVVNRVAAVLGLGGVAALVIGAGVVTGTGAGPRAFELTLGGALTATLLGLGLALFSGIGLAPLFHPETGRYRAPVTRAESAVRVLRITASAAFTVGGLALAVPWLAQASARGSATPRSRCWAQW